MDISLYLTSFLQYRIAKSPTFVELYVVDQYDKGVLDFLIKDDAARFDDEESLAFNKLRSFCDQTHGQIKHLYHRKHTSIQMTWLPSGKKHQITINDFPSLFAVLILSHPKVNFVFSYLSKKGEYVFRSLDVFAEFSVAELQEKETLMVFIEILKKKINEIKVGL